MPGIEHTISSDGFFELTELPKHTAIIGNGYIASELAGILSTFGGKVTICIRTESFCSPLFDCEMSTHLSEEMQRHGVIIRYNLNSNSITEENGVKTVHFDNGETLDADCVLLAIGRRPNIDRLGLETTTIAQERGAVKVDEFQNTTVANVYSIGDCTGNIMLTPVATKAGIILAERLFNNRPELKMDFTCVPTVMFTHPPMGSIGMTEEKALDAYGPNGYTVFKDKTMDFHYSMRATPEEKTYTILKLIVRKVDDVIIGFHVIGRGADEMT
jgi:glutathione reductase (NADPH)